MNSSRKIEASFFLLLAFGTAVVVFFIFKPYLSALFVAVVFALVFKPLHKRILRVVSSENLSVLLTLLVLLLMVLIPAVLFGVYIFDDVQKLYTSLREGEPIISTVEELPIPFEKQLQSFFPDVRLRVSSYLSAGLSFLVSNFGSFFSQAVAVAFKTVIMLLALFYLLREGRQLREFVVRLSPLANEYDERILRRLEGAVTSVVKGRLFIIVIQGLLAGVGFFIFGVSHPVLLGTATALAALVPAVGIALIFGPIVLYLFFAGSTVAAVGLLVVASIVGVIDNILAPFLFERGLQIHPFLILLSILGGFIFFGPVGFLAGPVALSLFFALLDIYPLLFDAHSSQT